MTKKPTIIYLVLAPRYYNRGSFYDVEWKVLGILEAGPDAMERAKTAYGIKTEFGVSYPVLEHVHDSKEIREKYGPKPAPLTAVKHPPARVAAVVREAAFE